MRKRPRFMPSEQLGTQELHIVSPDSLVEEVRDFALRNRLQQHNAINILLRIAIQSPKELRVTDFDEQGELVERVLKYK